MPDLNLPIFPFDSSAITVSTTVWIGVWVSVFFNLRLGWTLSGLVVPGYLVPLMMTRPISACVIFFEAILTYLIVLGLSERPNRHPWWSSFFGRDRFFVILIVSVLLRAVLDGFALPWIGKIGFEQFGINIDYRNNLHSFGLIVVALIANYFWKPGVIRGCPPIVTCIGLTYLITQFVLVPFTNFNVSNFHALYEDITTSLMSSPKSYIILISTAYLASWINLRYAWDFNGILIPSLLGLLWHDPLKILISGLECLLIYAVGSLLIKAPVLRNMTIQGGSKVTFFFTICFLYRLLICHLLPLVLPGFHLTDAFGFGYLLTTLMAIKIHDRGRCLRMLRATAEVSVIGAVAGSLIGFAFYCGPKLDFGIDAAVAGLAQTQDAPAVQYSDSPIQQLVRSDKVLLYEKKRRESYQPPLASELRTFSRAVHQLKQLGRNLESGRLAKISNQLASINYQLTVVSGRYVYLRERSPTNGWGIFVIDSHRPQGICIEVPAPMDEWGTIESALILFRDLPCSSLAIAGAPRRTNFGRAADVTRRRETMMHAFHRVYGATDALQVRGYTGTSAVQIAQSEALKPDQTDNIVSNSRVYVRGSVPRWFKLSDLKTLTGGFDIHWVDSPMPNKLREDTKSFFAELILSRAQKQGLIRRIADDYQVEGSAIASLSVVNAPLASWMNEINAKILSQGSNLYVRAKTEEMLFMDHEVLDPLLQLISRLGSAASDASSVDTEPGDQPEWLTEQVARDLIPIDTSARALGYHLTVIQDTEYGESVIALSEVESDSPRGWGTFVFRPGLIDEIAIEVPRPRFERRSFDFGLSLFHRPRSSALLIAGAHPRANLDGSADISQTANRTNLFNLVRHVLLRHLGDRPFLIAQARAIRAPVDADIVVATDDGSRTLEQVTHLKSRLLTRLTDDLFGVQFVTGQRETAGYELGILMQATAIQISQNKEVMSLWLSPSLRTRFRQQSENYALSAQFHLCKIPSLEVNLLSYLLDQYATRQLTQAPAALPLQLASDLQQYVQTQDVVQLLKITRSYPQWKFTRLIDHVSGQAYLLLHRDAASFPIVLNLTGAISNQIVRVQEINRDVLTQFIRSRALWLQMEASQEMAK